MSKCFRFQIGERLLDKVKPQFISIAFNSQRVILLFGYNLLNYSRLLILTDARISLTALT